MAEHDATTSSEPTSGAGLEERLQRTERRQRALGALAVVLLGVLGLVAWRSGADGETLRARRLVVHDDRGRPRVVLGAPVEEVEGRRRSDPTTGVLILDGDGDDRLNLGAPMTDPQIRGEVAERRVEGAGLAINDPEGDERGGFAYRDGRDEIGLVLDYPRHEALGLVAQDSATAVTLNSPRQQYVRLRLIVKPDGDGRLVVWDSTNTARMSVGMRDGAPEMTVGDRDGEVAVDVLEALRAASP